MKRNALLLFLVTALYSELFSQVKFEKGYIIDNDNQRIECLIKNNDWKNNPTEFSYKLNDSSDIITGTLGRIREFGIYGISKYISSYIDIDISSDKSEELTFEKDPKWSKEFIFLETIIDGKASLYRFQNGKIVRFFYSTDTSSIKQLVYKKYLVNKTVNGIKNDYAIENSLYKSQLWLNVNCNFNNKTLKNLSYKKEDLEEYFTKYNKCKGIAFEEFGVKHRKRDILYLNVTPGLNYSSLKMENDMSVPSSFDFGSKVSFRLGVEVEFILPFNKNKWAITIEPYYHYFKSEYDYKFVNNFTTRTASINYSLIEFPIGLRYYMYLNTNSRIFLSASFIPNYNYILKSDFDLGNSNELEIKSATNFVFGVGYKFGVYSIEYKHFLSSNILNKHALWSCDYNRSSLTFGIRFFKK